MTMLEITDFSVFFMAKFFLIMKVNTIAVKYLEIIYNGCQMFRHNYKIAVICLERIIQ